MWRVVRNADQYTSRSARRNLYRKVVEAILQSITASVALCVILFVNPDIGFIVCTSAFPSLIVSAAHSLSCSLLIYPTWATRRVLYSLS